MVQEIRVERTTSPKEKTADDKLGFGVYYTDHMFVMEYTEGTGWHDPVIVPYAPLVLDPAAMVLHYGQSVFEGLKAYLADDGRILLFRADKNASRLNSSSDRLCIPLLDEDMIIAAISKLVLVDKDWLPKSPGTSIYVRPFIISTEPHLGVRPSATYKFIIILSPVGSYYANGIAPTKIYIEDDYVRSVRGAVGFTKASANYAISLKGQVKAHEQGFTQVLWLDAVERKYIEEVGTSNAFFVIGGELVTPELNGSILPGITRDSVLTLARSWGMKVTERRVGVEEIFEAQEKGTLDEVFASGTAAVISPVGELSWNGRSIVIGRGEIGPVARKLYDTLTSIQTGKIPDPFGWVLEVKE